MSGFDKVAEIYEKKTPFQDMLFEMIEQTQEGSPLIGEKEEGGRFSITVDLPSMTPSEAWGDPNSQDRDQILKIFSVVRGGRDMKAKLQDINNFLDPKAAKRRRSPGVIINMMMVVEALQATLNDFNESAAGFVFEGFMAALTGGKQIAGKVGGTLPIEDFVAFSDYGEGARVPVSLKLLALEGVTKGSYTNIVDYLLVRGEAAIKYLIAFKYTPGANVDELQFWEFEVNRSNFVEFIAGVGGGDVLLSGVPARKLRSAAAAFAQDGSKESQLALAELISQTRGYKRGMIPAFLAAGGRRPDEIEQDMSPEEREELEKKKEKSLATKARKREKGRADIERFSESFHQNEKRILAEEEVLFEAGGDASQWKATWPQLKRLGDAIGLTTYGAINLSQDRIDELAEIYGEKLKGDVMTLLTETKNLADNIGSYYREKRRSKAVAAADTALQSTEKISDVLEKDPRYSDSEQ